MNLMELNQAITNAIKINKAIASKQVLVGDSKQDTAVIALVIIEKTTKFRETHIRIAEDLDRLIADIRYQYDFTDDDFIKYAIPIAGFTTEDICRKLNQ